MSASTRQPSRTASFISAQATARRGVGLEHLRRGYFGGRVPRSRGRGHEIRVEAAGVSGAGDQGGASMKLCCKLALAARALALTSLSAAANAAAWEPGASAAT